MSVILHEFGLIKVLNTSYIKMHCLFCFDIIVFISKKSVATQILSSTWANTMTCTACTAGQKPNQLSGIGQFFSNNYRYGS